MKAPKKHTIESEQGKYNYLQFDSVLSFNSFVDSQVLKLSEHNSNVWEETKNTSKSDIDQGNNWFGTPVPKSLEELELHRSFLGMRLLKEIQPKIKDKLSEYLKYLAENEMPKPVMAYNDRGLGIFSFDRAAMGMYKIQAVNNSSQIHSTISKLNIELGNKQIQTSVKSVYTYFQHKKSSYPTMQLYIMAGANSGVEGNNLLYVGLACVELVDFMEQRGVSVEINILIGSHFRGQTTLSQIRAKRFQDKLDKNQLLLMSSDPRYFRYRGFKALIAMADYFNYKIPYGLGSLTKSLGNDFVATINPKAFVFEQSYAMDKAVKEVSNIITEYKNRLDGKEG